MASLNEHIKDIFEEAKELDSYIKTFVNNRTGSEYRLNNDDEEEGYYYMDQLDNYINDLSNYSSANINDPDRVPVEGVLSNLIDNKQKLLLLLDNSTEGGRRRSIRRGRKSRKSRKARKSRKSRKSRRNKRKSRRYRK